MWAAKYSACTSHINDAIGQGWSFTVSSTESNTVHSALAQNYFCMAPRVKQLVHSAKTCAGLSWNRLVGLFECKVNLKMCSHIQCSMHTMRPNQNGLSVLLAAWKLVLTPPRRNLLCTREQRNHWNSVKSSVKSKMPEKVVKHYFLFFILITFDLSGFDLILFVTVSANWYRNLN